MSTHRMRLWATAAIASFTLANVAHARSSLAFYLADENDSCSPHQHVKSQEDCHLAAAQMRSKDMVPNGISSFNATAYDIYKAGCYAHLFSDGKDGNGDSSEYYDIDFFSDGEVGGKLKGFSVCKMSEEKSFLRYNQTVGNTENIQNSTMMTRLFNRTRSKRSKSKNVDTFLATKEGHDGTDILERGTKFDKGKKSKAGSSKSKAPKILGRYKRAKSNGKGSKGNVSSSCKSASEKSPKSGRRPKAFYNGKTIRRSKGTKAPRVSVSSSKDTKAPKVSSSKDTKAPKARDSMAKGKSKGNVMKNKSKGIGGYKGRKSAKSKGSSAPTKRKGTSMFHRVSLFRAISLPSRRSLINTIRDPLKCPYSYTSDYISI